MTASVQFYRNVLGMELLYGGERSGFSSLRAKAAESVILNLESGNSVTRWGRIIFHVTDVDAFWTLLKGAGFDPEIPQNASWGNATFTFWIRMDTSCHLLGRYRGQPEEHSQTKARWRLLSA